MTEFGYNEPQRGNNLFHGIMIITGTLLIVLFGLIAYVILSFRK